MQTLELHLGDLDGLAVCQRQHFTEDHALHKDRSATQQCGTLSFTWSVWHVFAY